MRGRIEFYHRSITLRWVISLCAALLLTSLAALAQSTHSSSVLLEAAGKVEFTSQGSTNWQSAAIGLRLAPGDRVRTRALSRAAVQLSDRSVIRLDERTTLEILPPRRAEKKRFGLPAGSLYFFNREKPADVEFETPLAAGAIRGTEFLLEAASAPAAVHLALIDGLVSLHSAGDEIQLHRGEEVSLAPGQPPRKTALIDVNGQIQWALYYPVVVNPEEIALNADEQKKLSEVLANYRAGDMLRALAVWPQASDVTSGDIQILHAQLLLAVGRAREAEQLLAAANSSPATAALRKLIAVVKGERPEPTADEHSASSQLARSFVLQGRSDLQAARAAARRAADLAPGFGSAQERLAELEFAFGNHRQALAGLKRALDLSPRLASALALQGFVLLDQGRVSGALVSFDQARELDAALGSAWLGRGLCLLRERKFSDARASLQAAAALEPQRSLFRSYLGKAASELGDAKAAEKEFRLAKQLDPEDPTAWLYSALHLWQENQLNAAIRDLEKSSDLNDNRSVFRSRLLLDEDRSVRSANLAAIYDDAGLSEISRHTAERSVAEDYANFSGHLFLADSYQALQGANPYDLRLETAKESELLVANLLAPPGAGNLSQVLSEHERLRFFDQRPFGFSSLTSYGSRGDWSQLGTAFGSIDGFSYAFDAVYDSVNGQRANNDRETRDFALTMKQRVTADDEVYVHIRDLRTEAGDIAPLYDPHSAKSGFRINEKQEPDLLAGWHHTWAPGIHTLLLASRLEDQLTYQDPQATPLFLYQSGGVTSAIQQPPLGPAFTNDFSSRYLLYSVEAQQIFQTPRQSLVIGGRWQDGTDRERARLSRALTGVVTDQDARGNFQRGTFYAYETVRLFSSIQVVAGIAYDHLAYPENTDIVPISFRETSREQISPKVGLLFEPWQRGRLRASYTRSLGGLFFDNSVRLEPTEVGGFNQAFRSLIPESTAGLLSGAHFESAGIGFDQSLPGGTWFGVELQWLASNGRREVGVLTNSLFLPIPDSPGVTTQTLNYRERNLSAYAARLLGDFFSVSTRYRLSEATLVGAFPDIPSSAGGLSQIIQNQQALLHEVSLDLNFHHPCGIFAQWDSSGYWQQSAGYVPALESAAFWQHNFLVGYRFARRMAEIRVGVLNLTDQDYRLNPLNLHAELPRARTAVASLRLNF